MLILLAAFVIAGGDVHIDTDNGGRSLVINEMMIRPVSSSSTDMGQWIELYNSGRGWVNLSQWTIVNEKGDRIQFSSLIIPPDGYFVVGASSIADENGNYTPNAVWGSFSLSPNGSLMLSSTNSDSHEFFSWDNTWNIIPGASLERLNPGWSATDPGSWQHSIVEFGSGDLGTPGRQNSVFSNGFGQNTWAFIKAFVD
jgi:hypothetical protein